MSSGGVGDKVVGLPFGYGPGARSFVHSHKLCRHGCVGKWYKEMVWMVVHILGVDLAYPG